MRTARLGAGRHGQQLVELTTDAPALMLLAMLGAMLLRPTEYTHHHGGLRMAA